MSTTVVMAEVNGVVYPQRAFANRSNVEKGCHQVDPGFTVNVVELADHS